MAAKRITKALRARLSAGGKLSSSARDMRAIGRLGGLAPNRQRRGGKGQAPKPTHCRKCYQLCPSARLAWVHCAGKKSQAEGGGVLATGGRGLFDVPLPD